MNIKFYACLLIMSLQLDAAAFPNILFTAAHGSPAQIVISLEKKPNAVWDKDRHGLGLLHILSIRKALSAPETEEVVASVERAIRRSEHKGTFKDLCSRQCRMKSGDSTVKVSALRLAAHKGNSDLLMAVVRRGVFISHLVTKFEMYTKDVDIYKAMIMHEKSQKVRCVDIGIYDPMPITIESWLSPLLVHRTVTYFGKQGMELLRSHNYHLQTPLGTSNVIQKGELTALSIFKEYYPEEQEYSEQLEKISYCPIQ